MDRSRLYLRPNTHHKDPIRSDASGMALLLRSDGAVMIDDVVQPSPASELGLARGDELRSIDQRDVQGMTLEALRDQLKQPGRKLALIVVRDGETRHVVLKTRVL